MDVWLGEHRVDAGCYSLGLQGHAALSAERARGLLADPLLRLEGLEVEPSEQTLVAKASAGTLRWALVPGGFSEPPSPPTGRGRAVSTSVLDVRATDPAACVQAVEALVAALQPRTVTLAGEGAAPCAPVPFMPEGALFVCLVHDEQTPFQRIQVGEHPTFGRVLFLNGEAQISSSDERTYTEGFVGGAYRPGQRRAMVLGGGDCGVVRELLRVGVAKILMIEIDERVVQVCAEHFPEVVGDALTNPGATIRYGDAFEYLRDRAANIDLIVYDLSDAPLTFGDYGPVLPLIKKSLAPGGRVAMQCGPATPENRAHLDEVLAGLRAEFENVTTREVDVPSFVQRPWVFAYADLPR